MPRIMNHVQAYPCTMRECPRTFKRRCDLERHTFSHLTSEHRQFKCNVAGCMLSANQEYGLKCHIRSIHKRERLECVICPKSFSDPSTLSRHVKRVHTRIEKQPRRKPRQNPTPIPSSSTHQPESRYSATVEEVVPNPIKSMEWQPEFCSRPDSSYYPSPPPITSIPYQPDFAFSIQPLRHAFSFSDRSLPPAYGDQSSWLPFSDAGMSYDMPMTYPEPNWEFANFTPNSIGSSPFSQMEQ